MKFGTVRYAVIINKKIKKKYLRKIGFLIFLNIKIYFKSLILNNLEKNNLYLLIIFDLLTTSV